MRWLAPAAPRARVSGIPGAPASARSPRGSGPGAPTLLTGVRGDRGPGGRSAKALCKNDGAPRGGGRHTGPSEGGAVAQPEAIHPSDLRVELGHAIFALVEPH